MLAVQLILSILFIILPDQEEHEWEKSLDKDNIIIYTRHVESSNFKEFLAETTMEGSIDKFIDIFTDVENYPNWMPDCKSAVIVDNPNANDLTYHMKLKVPFPFTSRDVIQQVVLTKEKSTLEVMLINQPAKVPEQKKYVRMQLADGQWLIKEISDNEISIRFQYFSDPGGDIPAWLVNSFIVKSPHHTLKNLRELMAD